jgi:hypothetical protein
LLLVVALIEALVLLAELRPPVLALLEELKVLFEEDDPLLLLPFLPEEELDLDFLFLVDELPFLPEELLPNDAFFEPVVEFIWALPTKVINRNKGMI